tara:strand:+ start:356 stop:1060 length:705 start_codon:yes stop_codon:yes gene_type:complete
MTTSGGRDGSGETMMPIHELNTKLRTIDTDAKKLKTEYEAVAKRRGREMLTEYSNEYLRMENTREYFSKPSSSSSLVLFPTKEENKAFSRAATRKRETAVLDARTKLERDLKPTVERMRDKFVDLLERVETSIPSALPKGACFSDTFKRTQTNLLKQHVSELDAKLAILENVLEKTKEEERRHLFAGTTTTTKTRRKDDPTDTNTTSSSSSRRRRNVLLVAIAAWFLEPKLFVE